MLSNLTGSREKSPTPTADLPRIPAVTWSSFRWLGGIVPWAAIVLLLHLIE